MKKTYMQPQMAVVKVEPVTLIAESLLYDSSETVTGNDDIGTKDEGDWDLWDDWDE